MKGERRKRKCLVFQDPLGLCEGSPSPLQARVGEVKEAAASGEERGARSSEEAFVKSKESRKCFYGESLKAMAHHLKQPHTH